MNIYIDGQLFMGFSPSENMLGLQKSDLRELLTASIEVAYTLEKTQLLRKLAVSEDSDFYNKTKLSRAVGTIDTIVATKHSELAVTADDDLETFDSILCFSSLETRVLTLAEEKAISSSSIDYQAGVVRANVVSNGAFVDAEYLLAVAEANAWLDGGSLPESVPVSVSVWATASGRTNEEAALDILTTRERFNVLLNTIRSIRLLGKAAINACTTSAQVQAKYTTVINELKTLAIPVTV